MKANGKAEREAVMLGVGMTAPFKAKGATARAIRHVDHVTYVAPWEHEAAVIAQWRMLGFHEHVRLHTRRYPATHIALVSGESSEYPWATMTGISLSDDAGSPINTFLRRYGAGIQHSAYNVDPEVDMEDLHAQMHAAGWTFMTGVLTYRDDAGARLRQMFVAPAVPYGPFTEIVQRLTGPCGAAFDGFDVANIEGLYEQYADYSAWLDRRRPAPSETREAG
jgi:hypothetical protein